MNPAQLEKRKRVMKRSIALSHCVCNVQKPCPCDNFRKYDVCECAGESLPTPQENIRLTEAIRKTGCSSKVAKRHLVKALSGLPQIKDPRVLVGSSAGDDAGVIQLSEDAATVLTVDVFSPSVDDAYTFGAIAAANSVSDIYAMGAVPDAALSIIGFPVDTMPLDYMTEMLRGGIDKMHEAGIDVVGGHSINDEELKLGFAVIGRAMDNKFVRNSGAEIGDAIVISKPLGGGIATFAGQLGRASDATINEVARVMSTLNKDAAKLMQELGVHAATDVTGFGLMGHMVEIAKNSHIEIELDFDALPFFEGVAELARQEVLPGAIERNMESVDEKNLDFNALTPAMRNMMFCPETSGGLLTFMPQAVASEYVEKMQAAGHTSTVIIGHVVAENEKGLIRAITKCAEEYAPLKLTKLEAEEANEAVDSGEVSASTSAGCCGAADSSGASASCCGDNDNNESIPAQENSEIDTAYKNYMGAVNKAGAIDAKNKALIGLALSVVSKCEPCVTIKRSAAKASGATEAELEEAAQLGVSFGGAPVGMFYSTYKQKRS